MFISIHVYLGTTMLEETSEWLDTCTYLKVLGLRSEALLYKKHWNMKEQIEKVRNNRFK